jgi:hypothetical protein
VLYASDGKKRVPFAPAYLRHDAPTG